MPGYKWPGDQNCKSSPATDERCLLDIEKKNNEGMFNAIGSWKIGSLMLVVFCRNVKLSFPVLHGFF